MLRVLLRLGYKLKQKLRRLFIRQQPQGFKPVILVTGCGSGIGLALAQLLYNQTQYRVVVTGRPSSLWILRRQFKADERFLILPLDVTSERSRAKLMSEISEKWQGVDILINNAGVAYRAVIEHMSEENEQHQLATNYLAPAALTRMVLPRMREAGRGKIINISSVSGMLAMPTMASYSASKYALEGMSEALWYEMKPLGVNVTLIQPGFIRSSSFEKVYHTEKSEPSAQKGDEAYADYYRAMTPFIARLMSWSPTTPERIAKTVLRVIQKENPPLWVPATIDAWAFYYLRRILPRRLLLPILFAALPKAKTWGAKYTKRRNY